MDRNRELLHPSCTAKVALRKESVDRNVAAALASKENPTSLSARRAWIEILFCVVSLNYKEVSLSARRAWIEILL